MPASINSTSSYLYLDSWLLASVVHLGTIDFCKRFLDNNNDPGGRQYAQMTQAARSCPANIAEGSSRRDTSAETLMKLTDVARATISELGYDYLSIMLAEGVTPWLTSDPRWRAVHDIDVPRQPYSRDLMHDVGQRILDAKRLFDPWLASADKMVVANAMLVLCGRINKMISAQLQGYLDSFTREGGFTERLTQSRLEARRQASREQGAPPCPKCGAPMALRYTRKGTRQGEQFWGCTDYPRCQGTRPLH